MVADSNVNRKLRTGVCRATSVLEPEPQVKDLASRQRHAAAQTTRDNAQTKAAPAQDKMNEVALDENLDALDPLRHLRDDADNELMPPQIPTVVNQTIELKFPPLEHPVKLVVDAGPGCGGVAWPAGEVLSRYLARRRSLAGQRVVELGSGTGLVGLVAGLLGAQEVVITDQAGEELSPDLPDAVSLILAADCVYAEPAFPLLVSTLKDLDDKYGAPEILFCYKKRRKADKRFFGLLKKHFTWTEVEDDPEREMYSREAITLLRLKGKE